MVSKQVEFEREVRVIEALQSLQNAWLQCEKAFINCDNINNFIVENYPFNETFTDINIYEWVNNSIDKIEQSFRSKIMLKETDYYIRKFQDLLNQATEE